MEPLAFTQWGGEYGIEQYIIKKTGCKPFSGAGICPRSERQVTILRSVDDTSYYDDSMDNFENPKYTLFGHCGDQDENEKRFNEPLLNSNKTKYIYLYRVTKGKNKYLWYGRYIISDKEYKIHPGKDGVPRKIIILSLKKLD